MKALYLTFFALGLSISSVSAQQMQKTEPKNLRTGEKVLVDNGKCPKGQVQEVTGGRRPSARRGGNRAAFAAGTDVNAGGQRRQRSCVARP
jgi:hypothetical protein